MLIVVAIIAILIAIAIPVFSGQLEKAREASDAANIRAKYAEAMVAVIDGGSDVATKVGALTCDMTQAQNGWQDPTIEQGLSNLASDTGVVVEYSPSVSEVKAGGTATFSYTAPTGSDGAKVTITFA